MRRVREDSRDRLRRRIRIDPRRDAGPATVMANNALVDGHPAKSEATARGAPPGRGLPLHPTSAGCRQETMPVGAHAVVQVDQRDGREVFRREHGRRAGWREARIEKRGGRSNVRAVRIEKMSNRGAVE